MGTSRWPGPLETFQEARSRTGAQKKAPPQAPPLAPGPRPYAVHRLRLAVQALRSLDEAADWVDGEELPVPVARRLQEAVAHGPVEALILVCGVDLIHVGAQRDLLWEVWGGRLLDP